MLTDLDYVPNRDSSKISQLEPSPLTSKNDEEFEYICRYHASGCIAILEKWVLEGYIHSKELLMKTINTADHGFTELCNSKYETIPG